MNIKSSNFLVGIFLVIIGGLFLLSSIDILPVNEDVTVSIIFASAGIVLILGYYIFKIKLWSLIVGASGLFIGAAMFIDETRYISDDVIPIIFFVFTGLLFLNSLRSGKKNWWAIIPGGYSFIFAVHVFLDMIWFRPGDLHGEDLHGVVFFTGSGLIFGIIFLLKDKKYNLDWAKFPSIISFLIAVIVLLASDISSLFSRYFFPVLLIFIGGLLLYKSFKRNGKPKKIKPKQENQKGNAGIIAEKIDSKEY